MSKKNKKNQQFDYFNMSPEEQKANAEIFHRVEQGEASILDALNYKVKSAPIAQSDYKRQIAEACFGIINTKETDVDDAYDVDHAYMAEVDNLICNSVAHAMHDDNYSDSMTENDPDIVSVPTNFELEENDDANDTESTMEALMDNVARIRFRYDSITGKMFIEDGLVSTPVSVACSSSIELNSDMIPDDVDSFGQMLSKIFYYIITCKHPAVIISEDAFNIEFSMYAELNFNKYVFFKNNGYVYLYVIDEGESSNFYSVADIFKMTDEDLLRYVVCAAYAANTVHNSFMHDDEDEVESVMDARHCIKELITLIEEDPETKYAGHQASGDVMTRMKVNDLQSLVADVRCILDNLLHVDDEDDEDEDDVDDTDDDCDIDDIDVNDFPDVDFMTGTNDIDDMLESIESTDELVTKTQTMSDSNTTSESTDDPDSMIFPVYHRHK